MISIAAVLIAATPVFLLIVRHGIRPLPHSVALTPYMFPT